MSALPPLAAGLGELRIEDELYELRQVECLGSADGVRAALFDQGGKLVGAFTLEQVDALRFDHQVGLWFPGQSEGDVWLVDGTFFDGAGILLLPTWDRTPLEGPIIAAHGEFAMTGDSPSSDEFMEVLDRFRAEVSPVAESELFASDGPEREPTAVESELFTQIYREVAGPRRWAYTIECP